MPSALCAEGLFDWEKIRTEAKGAVGRTVPRALGSFLEVLSTHNAPMTPPFTATKGDRCFCAFSNTNFLWGPCLYFTRGYTGLLPH